MTKQQQQQATKCSVCKQVVEPYNLPGGFVALVGTVCDRCGSLMCRSCAEDHNKKNKKHDCAAVLREQHRKRSAA